jgi:hypothetical protein
MYPQVKYIYTRIEYWENKLTEFQNGCPHINVVKTACSNTGNYDPSDDSYWYTFKCPDCDKFWREDQ